MAIYHLHVRVGSKTSGASAAAKAAYNLRQNQYADRAHELAYTASGNMPAWADDALGYWEATDTHERAKATLFREVEFALPHELPAAERHRLAHEFMASICDAHGLPFLLTVHEKPGNAHAHGLISERTCDGYDRTPETWFRRAANQGKEPGTGGARKARLGQDGSWLQSTRAAWAAMCNHALEQHGHAERVDHRTLEAQGITDRLPQIHYGPAVLRMEARGIPTDRGAMAMAIAEANEDLAEMVRRMEYGRIRPDQDGASRPEPARDFRIDGAPMPRTAPHTGGSATGNRKPGQRRTGAADGLRGDQERRDAEEQENYARRRRVAEDGSGEHSEQSGDWRDDAGLDELAPGPGHTRPAPSGPNDPGRTAEDRTADAERRRQQAEEMRAQMRAAADAAKEQQPKGRSGPKFGR